MFTIGRKARETYPQSNGLAAGIALANRYVIDSALAIPDPFTANPAALHIVAAVNVSRKASGIFMVAVQCPCSIASADIQSWTAGALPGAVASGGAAYGNWLINTGAAITTPSPATISMGVCLAQCPAGGLLQTMTLVGVNATPVPQGSSAIVIYGATVTPVLATPGGLLAVAYELP